MTLGSALVMAPLFPWPPHDGGRIAILHRIRELHRHGIRVTLLYTYPSESPPRPSELDNWCDEIVAVARPPWGTQAWRGLSLPYGVTSRYLPLLREALVSRVAIKRPDLVDLEQSQMGIFRGLVPASMPVVLGVHNLEHEAFTARGRSIGRSLRGLLYRAEAWRMRRYENQLFRRNDWAGVVFISSEERRQVEATYPHLRGRCSDVPPGCDLPPPPANVAARPANLAFVGALWSENNAEGLLWFIREAWPAVRARVPEATLTVGGHSAPRQLERLLLEVPGVRYLGFIPQVRPVYDGARGVILPVRVGGVKVKAVEALGTGLPCVGTPHAFEGLPVDPGVHCVASDDPSALADGCVRALRCDREASALGSAARRLVETSLTWEAVGRRHIAALEAAVTFWGLGKSK